MKVGAENRKELIALAIMLPLAIALAIYSFAGMSGPSTSTVALNNAPAAPRVQRGGVRRTANGQAAPDLGLDPTLRLNQLKAAEDAKYSGSGRNIFQDQVEIEPPKQSVIQKQQEQQQQQEQARINVPPPPPPIPLRFYGFASEAGEPKRIFLSQGEDIYIAREGEIVARRYRVVKINNNNVEIEDMQYNNKQAIPLSAQAPA